MNNKLRLLVKIDIFKLNAKIAWALMWSAILNNSSISILYFKSKDHLIHQKGFNLACDVVLKDL